MRRIEHLSGSLVSGTLGDTVTLLTVYLPFEVVSPPRKGKYCKNVQIEGSVL